MNEGNGTRRARSVVLWAFAVVLAAQVTGTAVFAALLVAERDSEARRVCRDRIAAHAEAVRDDRDSVGWDALAARVIEGEQIDTQARARQIRELHDRLAVASDLRSRAGRICATDPDFIPPT